jgi:hypothetical protein
MFVINPDNKEIYTIKGDTANFNMNIRPYERQEGDSLVFTVKKRYGAPPLMVIEADAENNFHIPHSAYDNIAPGFYLYDIQLTTEQGEVYTVVGPATMTIDIEITAEGDTDNE